MKPSDVTQELVQQVIARDAAGQAKYGATLDRADLTPEEWAQHLAEEAMDAAGYALSLKREIAKLRADAERYRWLRTRIGGREDVEDHYCWEFEAGEPLAQEVDATIDAKIAWERANA